MLLLLLLLLLLLSVSWLLVGTQQPAHLQYGLLRLLLCGLLLLLLPLLHLLLLLLLHLLLRCLHILLLCVLLHTCRWLLCVPTDSCCGTGHSQVPMIPRLAMVIRQVPSQRYLVPSDVTFSAASVIYATASYH
jgi:hypothetical protein